MFWGTDIFALNTNNIKSTGNCPMGSLLSVYVYINGRDSVETSDYWRLIN
jgi:hypothetical protein